MLARACRPSVLRLALAVIAGVAASGASIGLMATSAWLISRASTHPPVLHLMVAIVAVRAFGLSRGAFRYAERLLGHDAALRVLADLRVSTYRTLARISPAGLGATRRGDLVSQFVSDLDAVLDVLVRVILPYAVALGVGLCSVALTVTLFPPAGLALACGLVVVAFAVPATQARASRASAGRVSPLRGELAAGTVDLLHGLADLTACGAVEERLSQLVATDRRLRVAETRASGTAGVGAALTTMVAGCCVAVGLAAGAVAVHAGTLDGELLAVVTLTPLAVFDSIGNLPVAAARLGAARAALRRVASTLAAEDPTPEPASPALPSSAAGGRHVVELHGVHASWTPDRPVLRGVDLRLLPGRRVALIGASGAGKSTIAALLVRFLDPVAGSVTIDGIDFRDIPADEIRRLIRLCDDEAYLFDSTIEANLRIGRPEATAEQLREALAAARLLEWVETLPDGLSTLVGEHGVRCSGGQRRRLALARALLSEAAVLVLDEPTEHLDEPTAQAVLRDLLDATTGRTTLLITHRTAGLEAFDEIVLLDSGIATIQPLSVVDA
ncbi:MAG: thiol reductant ABC exporter subunit CydC [Micromonosporaceae bacterium]|nr:thiol reductant ABC exporter subunit CydC [Micromonosporaceae bacterium]